jgi:DNA-binding HxlR family transcriptional regulator
MRGRKRPPAPTLPAYDEPVAPPPANRRDPAAGSQDEQASTRAALAHALDVVGDRWTLLVVAALLEGPRRFGELERAVTGIAPNVLTQRLRHLERHGLVIARPYSERPVRVMYELSEHGRELAAPLRLLAGWGAARAPGAIAPRHVVCGTPLEVRWWCPVCELAVAQDAAQDGPEEELHFA